MPIYLLTGSMETRAGLEQTEKRKMSANEKMAWMFGIAGIVLIFAGFIVKPVGEISGSALGGAGEFFALVGGLMGIDHSAKRYTRQETNKIRKEVGLKLEEEEEQ